MTRPSLDIVVVNWNAGDQLRQCIDSIKVTDVTDVDLRRVVVVDNGSTDDSLHRVAADGLPLVEFAMDHNLGFAAACNVGARGSTADYLLFLNPDAALMPGSLAGPIRFLADTVNSAIGILGVQLIDETGNIGRSCARFLAPRHILGHMLGLNHICPTCYETHLMIEWDHRDSRIVDQVMGAFFLVRRHVFEALHGFDERFFVYTEDVDFAYRAWQEGWRSYYFAGAQAFHRGGGVSRQVKPQRLFYSLRSRILYGYKHFGVNRATLVLLGTLFVEPLSRLTLAAIRHSNSAAWETVSGYAMLWQNLPAILALAWRLRDDANSGAHAVYPARGQ
jgi:GT2 family glycosyltransferase